MLNYYRKDRNLVTANGTAALEFAELILKGLEFDSKENIEGKSICIKEASMSIVISMAILINN